MHDILATSDIESDLSHKSGKQKRNKEIKQSNNKATFNLSKKILHKLEDCWREARYLTENKQISRALIVEKALEIALKDFNTKKQTSLFYDKLVSNKKTKQ